MNGKVRHKDSKQAGGSGMKDPGEGADLEQDYTTPSMERRKDGRQI